jgi:ribonuclease Z
MKILLLGTGTPAPSLRRQSSGYLADTGSDVIVIDHGPGAHHRLLEAGYKATDVTHLFFTHYHYDHVMDYPRIVLTRWDHGDRQTPPLKVYGPPPLHEITDRFIGEHGAFALDIAARTESPASLAVYAARGGQGARPRPAPELNEIAPGDAVSGNAPPATFSPTSTAKLTGWRLMPAASSTRETTAASTSRSSSLRATAMSSFT